MPRITRGEFVPSARRVAASSCPPRWYRLATSVALDHRRTHHTAHSGTSCAMLWRVFVVPLEVDEVARWRWRLVDRFGNTVGFAEPGLFEYEVGTVILLIAAMVILPVAFIVLFATKEPAWFICSVTVPAVVLGLNSQFSHRAAAVILGVALTVGFALSEGDGLDRVQSLFFGSIMAVALLLSLLGFKRSRRLSSLLVAAACLLFLVVAVDAFFANRPCYGLFIDEAKCPAEWH